MYQLLINVLHVVQFIKIYNITCKQKRIIHSIFKHLQQLTAVTLYSACAVTLSCFRHYNRSSLLTYLLTFNCTSTMSFNFCLTAQAFQVTPDHTRTSKTKFLELKQQVSYRLGALPEALPITSMH